MQEKKRLWLGAIGHATVTWTIFFLLFIYYSGPVQPADFPLETGPTAAYAILVLGMGIGIMAGALLIWAEKDQPFLVYPVINWLAVSASACSYVAWKFYQIQALQGLLLLVLSGLPVICGLIAFAAAAGPASRCYRLPKKYIAQVFMANFLTMYMNTLFLSIFA